MNQPKFRADQIWQGVYQKYWNKTEQFIALAYNYAQFFAGLLYNSRHLM